MIEIWIKRSNIQVAIIREEKTKRGKFVTKTVRFSFFVPRRSFLWIFECSVYRACTCNDKTKSRKLRIWSLVLVIVKLSGYEQKRGVSSG